MITRLLRYCLITDDCLQEIVVGKWQVIAKAGDVTCAFKFRANSKVKVGDAVKIWSSDAGVDHEPPHNLVMHDLQWHFADQMTIQILNAQGEVR